MKNFFIILLCLCISIFSAEKYENGEIRFPARKLIDMDAGTYEVWFKQELKLDDETYRLGATSNRPICSFLLVTKYGLKQKKRPNEKDFTFINFGLFTDGQRFSIGAGFNHENAAVGKALKPLNLEMDKWHYAAISWSKTSADKYKVTTYCNGEVIRSSERVYKKSDKLGAESPIYICHAVSHHDKLDSGSLATIDSFKISKLALNTEEISKSFQSGSLIKDRNTLLVEDFSSLKTPKTAVPGVLSETGKTAHKQSERGRIYGTAAIVEGNNGSKAIQLFKKK